LKDTSLYTNLRVLIGQWSNLFFMWVDFERYFVDYDWIWWVINNWLTISNDGHFIFTLENNTLVLDGWIQNFMTRSHKILDSAVRFSFAPICFANRQSHTQSHAHVESCSYIYMFSIFPIFCCIRIRIMHIYIYIYIYIWNLSFLAKCPFFFCHLEIGFAYGTRQC